MSPSLLLQVLRWKLEAETKGLHDCIDAPATVQCDSIAATLGVNSSQVIIDRVALTRRLAAGSRPAVHRRILQQKTGQAYVEFRVVLEDAASAASAFRGSTFLIAR